MSDKTCGACANWGKQDWLCWHESGLDIHTALAPSNAACEHWQPVASSEVEMLRAEVERLREALEEIRDTTRDPREIAHMALDEVKP